jgi:DNA-binding LacI/PurR family transcriptional regulator
MASTLRDIAKACGKDISTVSRALRGDDRVRQATRHEVEAVAVRLGYVPNLSARSLAGARTKTIWYLIPNIKDPVQIHGVQEASRYLAEKGYEQSIILYQNDAQRYMHLLSRLSQGVTDGAIIVPEPVGRREDQLQDLVDQKFPVVLFDRHPEKLTIPTVTSDNAGASAEMARMLIEQGAKRFVVLFNNYHNAVEQARFKGAVEHLAAAGVPFVLKENFEPSFLVLNETLGVIANSQLSVRKFTQEHLTAAQPHCVAVFDDWQGDPYPAIQAIVCTQNLTAMARRACDLVLDMIEGTFPVENMHRIPPLNFNTFDTQVQ